LERFFQNGAAVTLHLLVCAFALALATFTRETNGNASSIERKNVRVTPVRKNEMQAQQIEISRF